MLTIFYTASSTTYHNIADDKTEADDMIAWTPEEVEKLLQHTITLPTDENFKPNYLTNEQRSVYNDI